MKIKIKNYKDFVTRDITLDELPADPNVRETFIS
jgi:hypothetical protein